MDNSAQVKHPAPQTPIASPYPTPAAATKYLDAFGATRRHWQVVVGAAVTGMLLAWIVTAVQPRRYRASAIAAVAPIADSLNATDVLRGVELLEQRTVIATVAALASTSSTLDQAMQGGAGSGYTIDAAVLPNTNLLRVDVEGGDATQTAAIANRVPSVLGAQARAMYKLYGVTPVSPATRPTDAISPRVERAVLAGLLVGLILGAVIAYTMERLRPIAAA